MIGLIEGSKVARELPYHTDVKRTPYKFYKFAREHRKDIKGDSLYPMYCRLCNLEKRSGVTLCRYGTNNKHTSFDLKVPGDGSRRLLYDPLRCRCDENSMQLLRQVNHETPRNYSPNLTRFMKDRFMNEVLSNFIVNETAQLPLSTLVIRWKLGKGIPTYDKEELCGLLSCYGGVYSVYKQTPNSATVVFSDISSACRVMQAKHLGEPRNKIHCVWYHKFMSNKAFYSTSKGLIVRSDPYVQMHVNHVRTR